MVIPLMAAELFGVRVLGRVMGIVLTADGVGEAVAPWLVGRMRDAAGSYAGGFAALIACALVGALAILFLPRPRVSSPATGGAAPVLTPCPPLRSGEGERPIAISSPSPEGRGGQGVRT
jgi:hypothetical protein